MTPQNLVLHLTYSSDYGGHDGLSHVTFNFVLNTIIFSVCDVLIFTGNRSRNTMLYKSISSLTNKLSKRRQFSLKKWEREWRDTAAYMTTTYWLPPPPHADGDAATHDASRVTDSCSTAAHEGVLWCFKCSSGPSSGLPFLYIHEQRFPHVEEDSCLPNLYFKVKFTLYESLFSRVYERDLRTKTKACQIILQHNTIGPSFHYFKVDCWYWITTNHMLSSCFLRVHFQLYDKCWMRYTCLVFLFIRLCWRFDFWY